MRVSDNATFNSIRRQVNDARAGVLKAQSQASSGLRVAKPSDDPVAAAAARRETSRKALSDAGKAATEAASTQLQGSDEALNDVYTGLTSARDIAMQGSSSTMGAQDRSNAAIEVRKIREQMVALANTSVDGKFVFAGYNDKTPAYDANGTYLGDSSVKQVEALPGLRIATSVTGTTVFGEGDDSAFAALDKLATALDANDMDAVKATYTKLVSSQDKALNARSQVGALMNSVTVAGAVAERSSTNAQLQVNSLVALDEITAASNLVQAKGTLDKAITIAQNIPTNSLVGGK
ncbi:MAG: flagellar hook-associated protein FlgL [Myxococcaceae bacterium]|nr:flagellar hook-associated protein FlgL [Myxococcaceae bacterium]